MVVPREEAGNNLQFYNTLRQWFQKSYLDVRSTVSSCRGRMGAGGGPDSATVIMELWGPWDISTY